MSDTDLKLLARYTRQHAEDAFAELVRRHLGLVYSAANIEAAFGLSEVLVRAGRNDEARQVLDDFSRNNPEQKRAIESSRASVSFLWTAPSEKPSN